MNLYLKICLIKYIIVNIVLSILYSFLPLFKEDFWGQIFCIEVH